MITFVLRQFLVGLLILSTSSIYAQKENMQLLNFTLDRRDLKVNEVLYYSITNINSSEILNRLSIRSKIEFTTLASILLAFEHAETLKLSNDEKGVLIKRLEDFAVALFQQNKYYLFEFSSGIITPYGVKEKIIANKKVIIVMLGGNCIVDDWDYRYILQVFNDKMKMLL